jgi:DNA-binding NarL/FixJ family response regulator
MRLLLVDNHRILSDGLKTLLEKQSDLRVVGQADNGRDGVRLAQELKPDIVIMDVAMPELNGIDATRLLLAQCPQVKVIALSMHSDKRYVAGMLAAGASGYVLKDCAFEELARAIRAVAQGGAWLSPEIAGVVLRDVRSKKSSKPPAAALASREREVLQLLAEGHSMQAIAAQLHLSVKTVETHRRNLGRKLGVTNLADLTRYAIREGLTSPDARPPGK